MASLAETFELVKQAEYESKLAALQDSWGEDEVRLGLMEEALDLIKVAQDEGELPSMDESQILDLGVAMVEEAISEVTEEGDIEKVASDEELYDLGQDVGVILAENGITPEDLEKVASEEEAEELGRACARELVARYEELAEELGD